jgi:hypothetical protein
MSRVPRTLTILLVWCYVAAGGVALAHAHAVAGGHDQHCATCRLAETSVAVVPAPPLVVKPEPVRQRTDQPDCPPAQAVRERARGRSPPSTPV